MIYAAVDTPCGVYSPLVTHVGFPLFNLVMQISHFQVLTMNISLYNTMCMHYKYVYSQLNNSCNRSTYM